ncbi:MAG: sugar ABC transporter permease [Turicibacter sp.]|nr:sugar ABC transporter permease [Turicibacter sp.]
MKSSNVSISNKVTTTSQQKKFSLWEWIKSDQGQRILVIVSFLIIPITLLIVFTYLPFVKMIEFSFYDMKYIGAREFVGFENYVEVFTREDCFQALKLSLYYMGGAVIQLALALYLATCLSFKTKGGSLFKGAIFFPYLISGIAVGFIFKFFYTRGFVLDTILQWMGFNLESLPYWLKDTSVNNWSLVATSIWRFTGQNMVLFIGAIMSVDTEMYEAADLDGATKWQKFKYIILPSIKTIVLLNLILSISGSLSAFEPPYVITNGTFGTGTYFLIMHKLAHESQKIGLASAMAIVLLGIIIIITVFQKLVFKYFFNDDDTPKKKVKKQKRGISA